MNCAQAKTIPIPTLLASLGMTPLRYDSRGSFYRSPWSPNGDHHPSLQVSPDGHAFHDWSSGRSGSIIDLALQLDGVKSVSDALRVIEGVAPANLTHSPIKPSADKKRKDSAIVIDNVTALRSMRLLGYLWGRGIHREVAAEYCREVHYHLSGRPDKPYYAIGWHNDSGGYELRNAFVKLASAPKDITTVTDLAECPYFVFEGFVDFLSAIEIGLLPSHTPSWNAIVMNSTALLDTTIAALSNASQVYCLLDHDDAGRRATHAIMEAFPTATDYSSFYAASKDLNDYLKAKAEGKKHKMILSIRSVQDFADYQ